MRLAVALKLGRVSNLPTVWSNVLTGTALAGTATAAFAISTHMAPEQAVRYRAMIAERIMPGTLRHDTAIHR